MECNYTKVYGRAGVNGFSMCGYVSVVGGLCVAIHVETFVFKCFVGGRHFLPCGKEVFLNYRFILELGLELWIYNNYS